MERHSHRLKKYPQKQIKHEKGYEHEVDGYYYFITNDTPRWL